MPLDIRKAVALAELINAVSEYEEALMQFDEEDDAAIFEGLTSAIGRAFLRSSGKPAQPDQLFDGLIGLPADGNDRDRVRIMADIYQKVPIPMELRWSVFRRDNFTCKRCGRQEDLHADHVVPESKGGPTTLENLQTLCGECNRKKGAR